MVGIKMTKKSGKEDAIMRGNVLGEGRGKTNECSMNSRLPSLENFFSQRKSRII